MVEISKTELEDLRNQIFNLKLALSNHNGFDLEAFRKDFLNGAEGWGVSDVYLSYRDKFLRKDAQDAYEGAKWGYQHAVSKISKIFETLNGGKAAPSCMDVIELLNTIWKIYPNLEGMSEVERQINLNYLSDLSFPSTLEDKEVLRNQIALVVNKCIK